MSDRVSKLGDIKGPKALEIFSSLLPLIFHMADDKEAQSYFNTGAAQSRTERLCTLISIMDRHEAAFYAIEAAKRGISVEECKEQLSVEEIFGASTELMTDPLFLCFFGLTRMDEISPISAPGNTVEH